jgi:deferrochelatase/peroxidase EfeB
MNPRKDPHARTILRRGVSYQNEDGEKGMLFQCFQSSLQDQFEFLMHNWANTASHPQAGAGRDPLIGAPSGPAQPWPAKYASARPLSISGLTTVHGGEYFYFPSIPSLREFSKHPQV